MHLYIKSIVNIIQMWFFSSFHVFKYGWYLKSCNLFTYNYYIVFFIKLYFSSSKIIQLQLNIEIWKTVCVCVIVCLILYNIFVGCIVLYISVKVLTIIIENYKILTIKFTKDMSLNSTPLSKTCTTLQTWS